MRELTTCGVEDLQEWPKIHSRATSRGCTTQPALEEKDSVALACLLNPIGRRIITDAGGDSQLCNRMLLRDAARLVSRGTSW